MSPIAKKTALIVSFMVGLILMYGHGYRSGRNAQLTMEATFKIVKAQYECRLELK